MSKQELAFATRKDARDFKNKVKGRLQDRGKSSVPRWHVVYEEDSTTKKEIDYSKTIVIITPKNILITLVDGTQYNVNRENEQFSKIISLTLQQKYEEMLQYIDIPNAIKIFTFGSDVKIENNILYYKNKEINNTIAQRIVREATRVDGSVDKYVKFFVKLQNNPSAQARESVYDFMVHNDLDILNDGNILAYKSVDVVAGVPQSSFRAIPNYKGWILEMPRDQVNDDPSVTCSYGLHVASREYAQGFAEYLLQVSVSPEDVVSVPSDYNNMKVRCCRYRVLTGVTSEVPNRTLLINQFGDIIKQTLHE